MMAPELDSTARDGFREAWIEFLETRGLYCAVAGGEERRQYAVASEASQATEADRGSAKAWLASRSELHGWRVGGLEELSEAGS